MSENDPSCLVCGTRRLPEIAGLKATSLVVLRCPECLLEFTHPIELENEASTETEESYRRGLSSDDADLMKMVRRRAEERLRFCTALLGRRPKSILEVGAAGGWFVQAFEELGVPASGIELDPVLVAQAQRRGANVLQADVTSWSPSGGVDVVWCSQTLEHIAAPRRAVCAMRDALNAGGLLEIDVPNGSSWGAMWRRLYTKPRVYGTIHAPHHQIAYRPCSLDRLLRSCDLDPLVLDERPTDDRIFGQVILPGSTLSRLAILGSHVLGHGYLLVSIARKPMGARSASQDGSNGS